MAQVTVVSGSDGLSVRLLRSRHRWQLVRVACALGITILLAALLLSVLPSAYDFGAAACVLVPALLVWLWRSPIRGLYVVFAAAVTLEEFYSAVPYPDDVGHYLPVFEDISTWTHSKGLSFSLVEVMIVLTLLIWVLKGIADRNLRFVKGPLWRPLSLYMIMVGVSEIHGVASGGVLQTSLFEVRSQVYMLVAYVLTCNLARTRKEMMTLVWILAAGTVLKAVQGAWRYYITLHHNTAGIEAMMPHEQSYFFIASMTLLPILYLFGGPRRLKRLLLFALPLLFIVNMANNRRASVLALAVGLLAMLILAAVINRRRRRTVLAILIALMVIGPPYYFAYQNKSGVIAEPARAIASNFNPSARDAGSDLYRVSEDKDILATMRLSPIYGYGYGKPMITPYPLPDISTVYIFWNIMTHNSIYWVWMRLGTIGYILLWLLVGRALTVGISLARTESDPELQGLALFFTLLIVEQIMVAYTDLQWSVYRNMVLVGVVLALLSRMAIARETEARREGRLRAQSEASQSYDLTTYFSLPKR